jgi:molybdopterin converting factor small subunit
VKVTVTCFGAIRDYLPSHAEGNSVELHLEPDATVEDAVDAIALPRRLVYALLVDDTQGSLDQMLHEGAEVILMPPFSGGTLD